MVNPNMSLVVPKERITVTVTVDGMGDAFVPRSSLPPEETVIFPPTMVSVEEATRLALSVPLIVMVLATASPTSSVTV